MQENTREGAVDAFRYIAEQLNFEYEYLEMVKDIYGRY